MNKIAPSTYLLVSFVLVLVSLIALKSSVIELKQQSDEFNEFQTSAYKYDGLKKSWGTGTNTSKKLDKIISQLKIKNINKQTKPKKIYISFEETDTNKIDRFLNKILNGNFKILSLSITNKSLEMEVGK
ncbi:MAG: hypothetical protein U9Q04_08765 [Campylobacterota bacterium]|nr:hypothetical protein [Campylobacterota bacterium]